MNLRTALRRWRERIVFPWESPWEPGTCRSTPARRHRKTGEVQFVLWKKGQVVGDAGYIFTYQEDFWIAFNSYWWPEFVPDKTQPPHA